MVPFLAAFFFFIHFCYLFRLTVCHQTAVIRHKLEFYLKLFLITAVRLAIYLADDFISCLLSGKKQTLYPTSPAVDFPSISVMISPSARSVLATSQSSYGHNTNARLYAVYLSSGVADSIISHTYLYSACHIALFHKFLDNRLRLVYRYRKAYALIVA